MCTVKLAYVSVTCFTYALLLPFPLGLFVNVFPFDIQDTHFVIEFL